MCEIAADPQGAARPFDHTRFLAGLSPDTRTALTERSDRAGLLHLALHAGLIMLLGGLIAARVPLWWALLLPQGVLLAFLFTLQHEATHKTPFATERLNEWVGFGTGLILVQPFVWFRYFHLAHHRHTNDPQHDSELAGLPKPDDWASFAWHLSCLGYWRDKAKALLGNAFGTADGEYVPARAMPLVQREARVMVGAYCAVAAFTLLVSPLLIWVWVVPLILGFPVLRLYLLAEHGRCPMVANMFDNTRTTHTNRAMRLLAWNMPYHTEHHVMPQVPFYLLPRVNAEMAAHLRHTAPGYAAFAQSYMASFGR